MISSFINAILAAPHNDEPRLAYADWLDQTCDPRGEFIRVQCRLERGTDSPACLVELDRRQRELLDEFEHIWAEPLAGLVDGWVFRRGLVEEVMMSAEMFVAHAAAILRLAPLREVHFRDAGAYAGSLAAVPELGRVHFLDFSDNRLGDRGISLLVRSPHLAGVHGINLSCTGLSNAGANHLARCPHLSRLGELYLSSNRIGDDGAAALARSPFLERVNPLFLNFNNFSPSAANLLRKRFGACVHL